MKKGNKYKITLEQIDLLDKEATLKEPISFEFMNHDEIFKIIEIINAKTNTFKEIPEINSTLSTRFNQKLDDIQDWISRTEWSQEPINEEMLNKVQNQLLELGIINKKGTFAQIAVH